MVGSLLVNRFKKKLVTSLSHFYRSVPSNSTSGDYKRTSTRIALSEATRSDCTTIELIDDTIVEEDEIFLVQVEQVVSSNDLRFPLDPEFVGITIIDDDGKLCQRVERGRVELNFS